MINDELQKQLKSLSEQYGFTEETIKKWYRKLLYHPELLNFCQNNNLDTEIDNIVKKICKPKILKKDS